MATQNITLYTSGDGSIKYDVQANAGASTSPSIQSGRLALRVLGQRYVTAFPTGATKPVVGTDYLAGVAESDSTETTSIDGEVSIRPVIDLQTYLLPADSSILSTISTQAGYNSLVGRRVLLNVTADGTQSVLGVDAATNGLVIKKLDIGTAPAGMVLVGLRQSLSDIS